MGLLSKCAICERIKWSSHLNQGICAECAAKLAEEQRIFAEEQRQQELREEELKRQAELKDAEELERKKRVDEFIKQREEEYAAYDTMVSAIQDATIAVSDKPAKKIGAAFVNDLTYSSITRRSDMSKLGNFVVIDTETTGLRYTSHEIIDIAAIRFRNFKPVAKFSTLLSPYKPIPIEATEINQITDEMVVGKPHFQQIAESLLDFIGDDNLVGHNLPFDLKFIIHYGADVSTKKRKYYDTLAIAQKTVKKTKMKWDKDFEEYVEDYDPDRVDNYKLETLCSYFGIITEDTHRAEADALATGLLFYELAIMRTE